MFVPKLCLLPFFLVLVSSQLSPRFYDEVCPQALPTITRGVVELLLEDFHVGPKFVWLHFLDCFVNGCDGSILLDDTPDFQGEKAAVPNLQNSSVFDAVDAIKSKVDSACGGSVVSCADILAVAARDVVELFEGPSWDVLLGRRDSKTASREAAMNQISSLSMNLTQLLSNFKSHGMNLMDLVVLSGAHTIGYTRCNTFKKRLYDGEIHLPYYSSILRNVCPRRGDDDSTLMQLDILTPAEFDTNYFKNLMEGRALFASDKELFNGGIADGLVKKFANSREYFFENFAQSMVKLGNIKPITGEGGEIRTNCRIVNTNGDVSGHYVV